MTNRAPLILAITLLLLPVLYVGSYLALVRPGLPNPRTGSNYRYGGFVASYFYWPLEQIDRGVRPDTWLG
jgi:hypothetical protein